jgi:hypothetical protein
MDVPVRNDVAAIVIGLVFGGLTVGWVLDFRGLTTRWLRADYCWRNRWLGRWSTFPWGSERSYVAANRWEGLVGVAIAFIALASGIYGLVARM